MNDNNTTTHCIHIYIYMYEGTNELLIYNIYIDNPYVSYETQALFICLKPYDTFIYVYFATFTNEAMMRCLYMIQNKIYMDTVSDENCALPSLDHNNTQYLRETICWQAKPSRTKLIQRTIEEVEKYEKHEMIRVIVSGDGDQEQTNVSSFATAYRVPIAKLNIRHRKLKEAGSPHLFRARNESLADFGTPSHKFMRTSNRQNAIFPRRFFLSFDALSRRKFCVSWRKQPRSTPRERISLWTWLPSVIERRCNLQCLWTTCAGK